MVNLTRIYTRTGDGGRTRLSDLSEVAKTDLRVEAYGDVDEANSAIGLALALGPDLPTDVRDLLGLVQNELFDLGADLSTPVVAEPEFPPLRITQASIDRLERWCDEYTATLPALRSFVLPGGSPAAAQLHLARTITRRAERAAWHASQQYGLDEPGGLTALALHYLNRLSDLLFILTRVVNGAEHDVLWVPGRDRPGAPEQDPPATDDHHQHSPAEATDGEDHR
ncbi:cob(I)alamin adenosyltransferase [Friedmanniella endophytica]|uniref:Corrinoid adenosyltransferase n=1 Tax=Microlunatus kandeliicorticis TaxID=1759536 RepID=A0A7W3IUI9_9ACTN|nr:cob(I)yrinic acid a,c-diamide adenosyltransferase [Microlunatus kandeliicorticis]MBA8795531.1 cob(I)alamin adenosyltransferase [Microlunatus kandeliicorticis]